MESFSYRCRLLWPRAESDLHQNSVLTFTVPLTVGSECRRSKGGVRVLTFNGSMSWHLWGLKSSRMDRIWLKMRQTHWWNYVSVIPTRVNGFLFLRVSPDGSMSMSEVWFPRGDVSLGKPVTHWEPRGFNPKQLLTGWRDPDRRDSMSFPIASC